MQWIQKFKVYSRSGHTYVVSIDNNGNWGCSCPAWTRGPHAREDCKHIIGVRYWQQEGRVPYALGSITEVEGASPLSMPASEETAGKVIIQF